MNISILGSILRHKDFDLGDWQILLARYKREKLLMRHIKYDDKIASMGDMIEHLDDEVNEFVNALDNDDRDGIYRELADISN